MVEPPAAVVLGPVQRAIAPPGEAALGRGDESAADIDPAVRLLQPRQRLDLDRRVAAAPDGVDAVFDLVGGDPLRTVAELPTDRHRLISVADYGLSTELGGQQLKRDRSTAVLTELAGLVADGALDPHVTDVRPFDDAADALALVEHGHATGKVVLDL